MTIYATIIKRRKPSGFIIERHPSARVLSDHCDPEGRRVWKCTACGNQGLWTASWTAYGSNETTEAVYCCDECRP